MKGSGVGHDTWGYIRMQYINIIIQNSSYTFMLRSPNQTTNQIRHCFKNDQSNVFVTVYLHAMKV